MKTIITVLSLFIGSLAFAKTKGRSTFPTSPAIEERVAFWEKVFNNYSSDQRIIHDMSSLQVILTVLDTDSESTVGKVISSHRKAMRDFALIGAAARKKSALHQRIYKAYRKHPTAYSRLIAGRAEIRSQAGLSDVFQRAAVRAQTYLPRMEKIFKNHGLPHELTRIAFVESMFNPKALSKVGASGIWQLMPASARPHIEVSRKRDERNMPFRATVAAARILKANHKQLGSWPLAVTAYNHGVNGVKRGVRQVQSSALPDIINGYRARSFGFASENFYAEFIAAKRSYARWENKKLTAAD